MLQVYQHERQHELLRGDVQMLTERANVSTSPARAPGLLTLFPQEALRWPWARAPKPQQR